MILNGTPVKNIPIRPPKIKTISSCTENLKRKARGGMGGFAEVLS